MTHMWRRAVLTGIFMSVSLFGQTEEAYRDTPDNAEKSGLLDPSRLTMHHSLSFGMMSASGQDLKSQSMGATMLQYQFSKPVTLNLNFGFPLHSTFYKGHNLNQENIESTDYFKDMPFDAHLTWQLRENMHLRFSVSRNTISPGYPGVTSQSLLSPGMFGSGW